MELERAVCLQHQMKESGHSPSSREPMKVEWHREPGLGAGGGLAHNFRSLPLVGACSLIGCRVGGRAFLVAQVVKNPPAMQETWVQSLG